MKPRVAAILIMLLLTGCANPIVLKNPANGEIAQCDSSYGAWGLVGQKVANGKCAEAYENAGWHRMN